MYSVQYTYHVIYVFVYVKLFLKENINENDSWKTFKHRTAKNLPAKYSEVKAYFSLFVCPISLDFLGRQLKAQLWLRMNTFTLNSLCKNPIAYFRHCIFYSIQIQKQFGFILPISSRNREEIFFLYVTLNPHGMILLASNCLIFIKWCIP